MSYLVPKSTELQAIVREALQLCPVNSDNVPFRETGLAYPIPIVKKKSL